MWFAITATPGEFLRDYSARLPEVAQYLLPGICYQIRVPTLASVLPTEPDRLHMSCHGASYVYVQQVSHKPGALQMVDSARAICLFFLSWLRSPASVAVHTSNGPGRDTLSAIRVSNSRLLPATAAF